MKTYFKETGFSYLVLAGIALVVSVVGRIGLAIADSTGIMQYDYIQGFSSLTLLNQICSVLTGPALFALFFTAGVALCIALATSLLFAYHAKAGNDASPATAILLGIIMVVVTFICLFILLSGVFSPVQVSQMGSKLAMSPMMGLMALLFLLAIGSLIGAASQVLAACVVRYSDAKRAGCRAILWAFVCGLVVMALTLPTFNVFNATGQPNAAIGSLWFCIDTVANIVIGFVAAKMAKAPAKAKKQKATKTEEAAGA